MAVVNGNGKHWRRMFSSWWTAAEFGSKNMRHFCGPSHVKSVWKIVLIFFLIVSRRGCKVTVTMKPAIAILTKDFEFVRFGGCRIVDVEVISLNLGAVVSSPLQFCFQFSSLYCWCWCSRWCCRLYVSCLGCGWGCRQQARFWSEWGCQSRIILNDAWAAKNTDTWG